MSLLEYLLVLTGILCCSAAPASDSNPPEGSCKAPERFPDKELQGVWNEEFYKQGQRAQYACRPGYSRFGSIQFVCSEGKWLPIGTPGTCRKKSCGHPGDIEFGTFELKNEEEFVFGAIVQYHCNDGYRMISKNTVRECTATGWSNYRPECEAKFCPPVQVDNNVNVLTTSYEEEYSVGQVIRFECKNAHETIKGHSEVYCTPDGEWNAQPPKCEEISCSKPKIDHGSVSSSQERHKEKDTTEYSCDHGYKPSTPTVITCTKYQWSPVPMCQEIVCYQVQVKYGTAKFTKETYREDETVELECNEGYQIEHNPGVARKCTSNGWSPPMSCISKQCDKPVVLNGYISNWYSFPMSPGRSFRFYCNSGYYYARTSDVVYCTKNGWEFEPKCLKLCYYPPSDDSVNGFITKRQDNTYLEGDTLNLQCYQGYTTLNKKTATQIKCLPDGKFSTEKCSKICQTPKLLNGEYSTKEKVFAFGEYVYYKCNEGFLSNNKEFDGRSQCGSEGWLSIPECKEIICTLPTTTGNLQYKFGNVVHFKCPTNSKLEGSRSIQCFYNKWAPDFPTCRDSKGKEQNPSVDYDAVTKESNCPTAPAPHNGQVKNPKNEYLSNDVMEVECDLGYLLSGPERVLCKDGKWQSFPLCIKKISCSSSPPQINNGQIVAETLAHEYYTGSTVKYICNDGYHIIGSNESICMEGKWLPAPTCVEKSCENPPEIDNGNPLDNKKIYKHGESAAYKCSSEYELVPDDAVCLYGKWMRVPKCVYSSCGQPPVVINGDVKGEKKAKYLPGEKVTYNCNSGYTMGQNPNFITCKNAAWTEPPECKRIGQACGQPPVVQFGDITETKKTSYASGSFVKYKCANYYKLEGKEIITCRNGEWEKQPVCRVPCTVREIDMEKNNIQLKWVDEKKLYSEHFDNMTFSCKSGYKIADEKLLRIQCLDGVLNYPKCLKEGFCVLLQTEMSSNNIQYNKSNEIENGQTIEFECVEGTSSESSLKGTCINKKITYPKCSFGSPCLPPKIPNAVIPLKKDGYESGSSIEIKCEDKHILKGHVNVKCENGQWDELPECRQFKSCTISSTSLNENNIELKPSEKPPEKLEHDAEVNVKCKATFKRPGTLSALCNDGVMKYPRCFSGGFCRINQQNLDDNNLELDKKHDNEVFYGEGETVSFTCKARYSNRTGLTGTCIKTKEADKEKRKDAEYELIYPACT